MLRNPVFNNVASRGLQSVWHPSCERFISSGSDGCRKQLNYLLWSSQMSSFLENCDWGQQGGKKVICDQSMLNTLVFASWSMYLINCLTHNLIMWEAFIFLKASLDDNKESQFGLAAGMVNMFCLWFRWDSTTNLLSAGANHRPFPLCHNYSKPWWNLVSDHQRSENVQRCMGVVLCFLRNLLSSSLEYLLLMVMVSTQATVFVWTT
jgi:hypothetical protein